MGGCIGIMENTMETTTFYLGVYRGCAGIMEKKMEATTSH